MGELSVRRNRELAVSRYQGMNKTEKQTGTSQTQQASKPNRTAATVSETLRQLMTWVTQAGRQAREGRRTLQSGEAALAEVENNLGRMEELAREAAEDSGLDRAVLQAELEQLRGEIDRIAQNGVEAGLFQDGEAEEGLDALVDAVMDGLSARQEGIQSLPSWLLRGMDNAPDKAALLAALGVDGSANGAELLAALGKLPLESSSAAGYLAALYLGAVISGGTPSGAADPTQAAEGLRQLLEMVADGISPDQALELLTGGAFTSLEDFQAQFTGGTAPGLDTFLMDLLLSGDDLLSMSSMLTLLAEGAGGDLEMLMDLLAALGGSGDGLMGLLDGIGTSENVQDTAPPMETLELETVQMSGQDLSAVNFGPEAGSLTAGGTENMILRDLGQEGQENPALRLTGSGTITLQQINSPLLTAESPQTRVFSAGENTLAQVQLKDGVTLTVDGGGLLRIGEIRGGASSVLRLTGGAVVLSEEANEASAVSVVVDGPAVLLTAEGVAVRNAQGEPLEPFDIVWKMLLPEWSSITSLALDGRQGQLILREDQMDPVRLWLLKQDSDEKWPAHTIALRGRDKAGHPRTRYIYVRWDEKAGSFREISMYPNPFTVTGGEQDVDWRYEEETCTLHILSREVTAIAGGTGTDGNQLPFSGRISLADGIGAVELTLEGVECRVSSGRAFNLGRGNDVTLLLQRGTDNVFESGTGCAGISLGDGTSLHIDQVKAAKGAPDGTLTATGGAGGAGIGRDSSVGRERTGPILIRGGVITATGIGGGAGIGGALGAPVGDIRIQGGTVTAQAACCAAAIGAGIQGACGDIIITGSARVVKAQGGGPDGDIGGCLFGNCGKVQVSAGTDIGGAKLWTQKGLSLQVGEGAVTLPRFRVSAQALHLDALDLTSREAARAAMTVLAADRRWVTRLQGAYGAMYGQLGQSFSSMYSFHSYTSVIRTTGEADTLVCDIREVLRQSPLAVFLTQRGMEDVGQLLR
ncbi:MAG: hypothetical protein HDT33_00240 [Clostridiales bacterium]|nr:hypothetical protein [Clostridiales bacterium]